MVKCQNCDEVNRPGAIFCRGCGGRLLNPEILSKEEEKRLKTSKQRIEKSIPDRRKPLIHVVIVIGILFFLFYLITQPVSTPRALNIADRYIAKCETKLLRLKESFNNLKKYRIAITEDELNSFLKDRLKLDDSASLKIFLDDGMLIYLSSKVLGKDITLKIYSGLLVESTNFKLDILQVRLGKLPIPSFLLGYLINKIFLQKFANELICPPYITEFEFSDNLMYVKYDPAQKETQDSKKEKLSVDNMLKKANDFYKMKNYQEALVLYEKIIKEYPQDPRVTELEKWCQTIKENLL